MVLPRPTEIGSMPRDVYMVYMSLNKSVPAHLNHGRTDCNLANDPGPSHEQCVKLGPFLSHPCLGEFVAYAEDRHSTPTWDTRSGATLGGPECFETVSSA